MKIYFIVLSLSHRIQFEIWKENMQRSKIYIICFTWPSNSIILWICSIYQSHHSIWFLRYSRLNIFWDSSALFQNHFFVIKFTLYYILNIIQKNVGIITLKYLLLFKHLKCIFISGNIIIQCKYVVCLALLV